jgi:hypothetical protein
VTEVVSLVARVVASSGKVCVSVEVEVVPAGVDICRRGGSIEEGDACRVRTF